MATLKEIIKSCWFCFATFFITVATILGTGVLALPVKVSESGFWPFMCSFIFTLIAQIYDIIFMAELLQITDFIQKKEAKELNNLELTPLNTQESSSDVKALKEKEEDDEKVEKEKEKEEIGSLNLDEEEKIDGVLDDILLDDDVNSNSNEKIDEKEIETSVVVSKSKVNFLSEGPNLYFMGNRFLSKRVRWIFWVGVIVQFVSILISYSIAGPQCIAKLICIIIGVDYPELYYFFIFPFVLVLSLIIVFGSRLIEYIISVLTSIKGFLLIVMIFLTGFVSLNVTNEEKTQNNWIMAGRPFLIGTVALGGVTNTMPIIFAKLSQTKWNLRLFKISCVAGLFFCFLLNIFWAFFILEIIPNSRLLESLENEEISTVPLIDVIETHFRQFEWLSYLVDIFVLCSVCVSFMCIGSGLKHMLDGVPKSINQDGRIFKYLKRKLRYPKLLLQFLLYVCFYSSVFLIAQIFPQTFFIVMEVFVSFSLNMESGLFICVMVWAAMKVKGVKLVCGMSKLSKIMIVPVFLFFFFAVMYDFFIHGIDGVVYAVNLFRSKENEILVPF